MQRFFLLLFFLSVISFGTQAQEEIKCNNWQKYVLKTCNDLKQENLKGHVKNIRQEIENISQEDGKETSKERMSLSSYSYNEKGYLTEISGSLRTIYQYDNKDRLIKAESDERPIYFFAKTYVYIYDDKNRNIETTGYNEDNSVYSKSVEIFDGKGNLIERNYCFENKDLYYFNGISLGKICETKKYDEKERIIESSTFDADGSLFMKYQYTYNDKGNRTANRIFVSPKYYESFNSSVIYELTCQNGWWNLCKCDSGNSQVDSKNSCSECDKNGNCIKRINERKNFGENLFITTNWYRIITYY